MFAIAIATLTANARVVQVATMIILLAAMVLFALALIGLDEAEAATRCTARRMAC
jgi:hypothetical protein